MTESVKMNWKFGAAASRNTKYAAAAGGRAVEVTTKGRRTRNANSNTDIWLNFSVIVLPPLVFSALLLGLVYSYRVTHGSSISANLSAPDLLGETGVYYVQLSATVLIFIASWSSSLAPLLVGAIMNLASYPISQKFGQDIRNQQSDLPTPYQMAIVIKFIAASGWGALYNWMEYLIGWRKQRQVQSALLTTSAAVTILATALGLLVFLADTWLHITTSTVNFVQVNPSAAKVNNHSLILLPQCLTSDNALNTNTGCNYDLSGDSEYLANAAQSIQALTNLSETVAVLNNGPDPTYAFLGVPGQDTPSWDFTATTFGMKSECKPVSDACNLNAYDGASTPFRCTEAFTGDLSGGENGWQTAYFPDQNMVSNETTAGSGAFQNPFYYGVAALFRDVSSTLSKSELPQIVYPTHSGIAFVLLCSITTYEVEYDSINGTVTRFVASPSNTTVSNVWSVPLAYSDITAPQIQTAALTSAFLAQDAQNLADRFAIAYSKIALAIGAQSIQGAPAIAAQKRSSFLVTRLPLAPLFSLIVANLLFVLLGIIMTTMALLNSGGEAQEIRSRLNIIGLVADRFETSRANQPVVQMSNIFEEYEGKSSSRVVIQRTNAGGYRYKTWSNIR